MITHSLLALIALASAPSCTHPAPPQDGEVTVWSQAELEELAKEIEGHIEEIRGSRFKQPVAVEVADKATLIDYMKRRTEMTESPAKLKADETIAKLLGTIGPEVDLMATAYALLEDQVGGFYDPSSKTFFLMDTMPKGLAGSILSHELVHALDDQLFDLDGSITRLSDVTDWSLAYACVAEGSGTAGMNRWALGGYGEVDASGSGDMMSAQMASLAAAPEWLWKPLMGVYMQGAAFLAKSDNILTGQGSPADSDAIEAAFAKPPRSTEQVLHPEKYWDEESLDEPRAVTFELAELPRGWSEQRQDILGEMSLAIVCEPLEQRGTLDLSNPMAIIGVTYTNELAAGWGGDRLILLGNEGASWLRLVSVWDSERDAGEFYAAMSALLPHLERQAEALAEAQGAGARSGAELGYGEARDEVVLTVWSGLGRRSEERKLNNAVSHSAAPAAD